MRDVDPPIVSVIMNCLNSSKYLREAIDSVYAQTFKGWEIIFWDNASSDNSGEIAKSYDNRLQYYRGQKTVPLYAARNSAFEKAKGKYFAILDCDDLWFPNKLELQVKAYEGNKNIGLIYTNAEILEPSGSKRTHQMSIQPSGRVFRELLNDYRINLQTVMVSRSILRNLDYIFDESMNSCGDADLFLRIAYDWEVLYLPEITAQYREHEGSISASEKVEALIRENEKVLRNLEEAHDGFLERYEMESKRFIEKTRLAVVLAIWKYADGLAARKAIVKHMRFSFMSTSLFLLTLFFPFRIVGYIRNRISLNFFLKVLS
ncbi:MAG: glycosyltransferase [Candidatus Brocadiaceae bacterium]|nr:glycosyltransferase [Candidatus Brocadiaceae bacterium]